MATGKSNTTRIYSIAAVSMVVLVIMSSVFSVSCSGMWLLDLLGLHSFEQFKFSVCVLFKESFIWIAEKDMWKCHRLRFDCDEIKCDTKCQVLYGGKSLYNKCGHYQVCCCRLRSNLTYLMPKPARSQP